MEKKFNFSVLRKVFPFVILVALIGLCAFVGNFKSNFVDDLKNTDETSKDIMELEWNFVEAVIYEDYLSAGIQAKIIAEEITEKIKETYPNLEDMRYELDNSQEFDSPKYLQIMKQSIQGIYLHNVENDDNDMFVCTREGIIMDTSPSTAALYPDDWESIYSRDSNPNLMKNVVASIFNRTSRMIYWEHHHVIQYHHDNFPILPSDGTMEELHQIYIQYGLEGLKHVQFLAPAYITETGDIFGIEDVNVRGISNYNHKIVVVQTFNPYDQIISRHLGELEKFNTFKTKMIEKHRATLIEHAVIVIIAIVLAVVVAYFMMLFNNVIFYCNKSKQVFKDDESQK